MAFSMFLRSTACTSSALSKHMSRLATTPRMLATRSITSTLPVRTTVLKDVKTTTPLLNVVRSFRTSAVRASKETPHDHARLWVIERGVTVGLLVLVPIGLLLPNKLVDMVLSVLLTAHAHWGLEAIAVDYVRASIFGPVIPKIAIGLVYFLSIATLGGLFYLISHDVGLCNAVRQLWSVKSQQKA